MRTKLVNRYWCDFCRKAGLQAAAMRKHEAHCTLNPKRGCRVCPFVGSTGNVDMPALVAIVAEAKSQYDLQPVLPDQADINALAATINQTLVRLREETENCPACIMAAFRQAGVPLPLVDGFNFSAEMKAIWEAVNRQRDPTEHMY